MLYVMSLVPLSQVTHYGEICVVNEKMRKVIVCITEGHPKNKVVRRQGDWERVMGEVRNDEGSGEGDGKRHHQT